MNEGFNAMGRYLKVKVLEATKKSPFTQTVYGHGHGHGDTVKLVKLVAICENQNKYWLDC